MAFRYRIKDAALTAALAIVPAQAKSGGEELAVLRIGEVAIRVSDVERRLSALPDFQLLGLGSDPDQIRKSFVLRVLVGELLYSEEARRLRLTEAPAFVERERSMRAAALEQELLRTAAPEPSDGQQVLEYYRANLSQFEMPRRIRIWRILVENRDLAVRMIDQARRTDGPERWRALAKDYSLDQATRFRDGDLGFVRPDGTTDQPGVRVDPALFSAVEAVADGALVAEPVLEQGRFAVVWRRGSLPAVHRTLEQAEGTIRGLLAERRFVERRRSLLESLRKRYVREVNHELLRYVR
ncbi:MAG TPA: peptidylprolyl isomerase [Polyangiaceae bacterium]